MVSVKDLYNDVTTWSQKANVYIFNSSEIKINYVK